MDLQEAYKVLGVSENATENEIENQYMTWVRRDNAHQSQTGTEKPFDFELITDAYNVIKSYKEYGSKSPQEFDSFRERVEHFFRYYKIHMLVVIILIIVCGSIVQAVVDHRQDEKALASLPPENLSIMLYGGYFSPETNTTILSENVLEVIPSWDRVTITLNHLITKVDDSMDVSYQGKNAVLFATSKPDIYIMDKENFNRHVNSGMFQPLDQLEPSLKNFLDSKEMIYAETIESSTKHLYGVEITDTSFFEGIQVSKDEKVIAVRADAKHKDNAMKLILELTNENE
ncbi:hypothetical protein LG329_07010 [Virgibacillus necropolis]|uniref:hypothetical protein n=1 Tax=Virgibacillus necropolis TaxID=163877 RepID=UPI00384EA432